MFINIGPSTSHKNDEIINFMYNNNVDYQFIPAGLTSKLQPLDLSVNKVFKNSYIKKSILIMLYLILKISLTELKSQLLKIF